MKKDNIGFIGGFISWPRACLHKRSFFRQRMRVVLSIFLVNFRSASGSQLWTGDSYVQTLGQAVRAGIVRALQQTNTGSGAKKLRILVRKIVNQKHLKNAKSFPDRKKYYALETILARSVTAWSNGGSGYCISQKYCGREALYSLYNDNPISSLLFFYIFTFSCV